MTMTMVMRGRTYVQESEMAAWWKRERKCISDAMGEAKRKELQGMHEGKDKGGEKQRGRKQTWTRARVANQ